MNSDLKAAYLVQKMKIGGGYARLSYSQIACLIVNMSDAKENLEPVVFERVLKLFYKFRSDKKKIKMDLDGYYAVSIDIIKQFNSIAPYEKYSGEANENATLELLAFIKSNEGIALYERNIQIINARKQKKTLCKSVLLASIVVALVALCFYVYEVTILFDGSPDMYYSEIDGVKIALKFTDRNHFSLYYATNYEDTDEVYLYGIANYVYSGHKWKHLIGPLYFQDNRFLSIKYVPPGIDRSTISFYCKDYVMYDWWGDDISDQSDVDDEVYVEIFDKLDNGTIMFDGMAMEEIDEFPDEIKPYWDLLKADE